MTKRLTKITPVTTTSHVVSDPVIEEINRGDLSEYPATADMPPEYALEKVMSEIGEAGTDARVMVKRILKERSDEPYLFTCSPGEFSLDEVARRYGGGDYRVRVINDSGQVLTHKRISIEEPKGGFPSQSATTSPSADLTAVLAAVQAGFEKTFQALTASQPKPESRAELLQELRVMSEIFQPQRAPESQMNSAQLFMDAIRVVKDIMPRGEGGESAIMEKAVETLLPAIGDIVKRMGDVPQGTQPAVLPNPVPARVTAPLPVTKPAPSAVNSQSTDTKVSAMNLTTKLAIDFVLEQARRNNDPQIYAEMVIDNVPLELIERYLTPANWLDNLKLICSEAPQYAGWFSELRQHVMDVLTEIKAEEQTSGSASPKESDAAKNESSAGDVKLA